MEEEHTTSEIQESPSPTPSPNEGGQITLKKSTLWKLGTFIFAALFLLSFFGYIGGGGNSPGTGAVVGNNPSPSAPSPGPSGSIQLNIEADDPVLGDPDAPIKIVEFSDFQCPFCARAALGAIADLKNSDYFKDGEVALIYKQFPLNSIHPYAQKAGEASLCAHDQGKFWEYHDLLFANQGSLDDTSLKKYAADLGLDIGAFDSCLDDGDKAGEVTSETTEATNAGGRGTPYFVVVNEDGETQAVSGAVPFSQLEAAIKALQ